MAASVAEGGFVEFATGDRVVDANGMQKQRIAGCAMEEGVLIGIRLRERRL